MKVRVKPFWSALTYVGQAIKDSAPLPVLSHVRLVAEGGTLTMTATGLDIWIQNQVECDGDLEPICVQHSALSAILKLTTEELAEIELSKDKLVVKLGKSVFRLNTLDAGEFPSDPKVGPSIAAPASALSAGLRAVAWAIAKPGQKRPALENVVLDLNAKRVRCFAGNGYSLASFREECICADEVLTVPGIHAIKIADTLMSEGAFLWASPNYIGVETKHSTIAVKRSEEKVPALDCIIEEMEKPVSNALLSLSDLKAACAKASLLDSTKDGIARIKICIAPGLVEFSGTGNIGDFQDSFEWTGDYSGTIKLNSEYLSSALRHFKAEQISVSIQPTVSVWSDGLLTVGIAQLIA